MYEVRNYPEYSVALHLKQSKYVYIVLRVQGKARLMIHSLHFMLARDVVVGHDPLMYEWDMLKVASALKQQRLVRRQLTQLHILFDWPTIQKELDEWLGLWKAVTLLLRQPTHNLARPGPARKFEESLQHFLSSHFTGTAPPNDRRIQPCKY